MSATILITLAAILCFLLRLVPAFFLPRILVSDTYFHYAMARKIRRFGFRIPATIDEYVLPNTNTYPYFFHFLWALFPERVWPALEKIINPFWDTVNMVLFYFIADAFVQANGFLSEIPIVVAGLYIFAPALLRMGDGPRAYNANPRVFGQTLYLVHLIGTFLFIQQASWIGALLSVASAAAIFVTAIFSIQVMMFFALPIAILISPVYAVIPVAGWLLAWIASRGHAWKIFRGIFNHLVYYSHVQKFYLYPHAKTISSYVRILIRRTKDLLVNRWWKEFLQWFYQENYFLHLLITVFPFMIVNLICAFYPPTEVLRPGNNSATDWLWVISLSSLVIFVLTKHKPLLFLGSGERYLEYAIQPSLLLFVCYSFESHKAWLIYVWLGYSIISAIYFLWNYVAKNRAQVQVQEEVRDILQSIGDVSSATFFPMGVNHARMIVYYLPGTRVLIFGELRETDLVPKEEFEFIWMPGGLYPQKHLEKIVSRYNVNYIFTSRKELNYYLGNIYINDALFYANYVPVAESTNFIILKPIENLKPM